jgi:hypothetical protein
VKHVASADVDGSVVAGAIDVLPLVRELKTADRPCRIKYAFGRTGYNWKYAICKDLS